MEHNPRLAAADFAVEAARKEVRATSGEYAPRVDLNVDWDHRDTDGTLFGGGSETETTTAMVTLRQPLFTGMRTRSRVREAKNLYVARQQETLRVRREIERLTLDALYEVVTAQSRVRALTAAVEAEEAALKGRRAEYRSGKASSSAVLDAERDMLVKRIELIQAKYNGILGGLRLKHSVGKLTMADIESVSQMMNGGSVTLADVQ